MGDFTNIETFVAAARAGSFAAAARQLGVTPALVGRRIQALEDRHGARLIERTTRAPGRRYGTAVVRAARRIERDALLRAPELRQLAITGDCQLP